MSIIKKALVESVLKQHTVYEKTLQYFDRSTEAKLERLVSLCNKISSVL